MRFTSNYSIGVKIFGAFVAMSVIIALLGVGGYAVLAAAGDMAVTTFDGPLMAINYARAAQTDFTQLEMDELRYEHAVPADKKRHRLRHRRYRFRLSMMI